MADKFPAAGVVFCGLRVWSDQSNGDIYFKPDLQLGGVPLTLPVLAFAELDRLKLGNIEPRIVCCDEAGKPTDAAVRMFLRREIAACLQKGEAGIAFSRFGWAQLPDGRHIYATGDRIIGSVDGYDYILSPELRAYALCDDVEKPDSVVVREWLKRISRDAAVLIPLAAFVVRSLLLPLFDQAGFPLRFLLYLVGVQGSGKTTAVNDFALLLTDRKTNMSAPAARALSSKAAARDFVTMYRDLPVSLDDVCTSTSAETRRQSKETAAAILRFAADRIPEIRKLPGGRQRSMQCEAGVIITGEFPMRATSDLTRCVIVNVDHQMKHRKPDDRRITTAAISRFLAYSAANYDEIGAEIAQALHEFRADESKDSAPRQQQHLGELSCAFQLFVKYAAEIGALSDQEVPTWTCALQDALEYSLSENNRLVESFEAKTVSNIAKILVDAMKNDVLLVANDEDEFVRHPDDFDGFKRKKVGKRFLRLDSIANLLTSVSGRNWTANETGKCLRENGLVNPGKENHTAKAKFPGLGRFVPLDWKQLKQQAQRASIAGRY